MALYLPSGDWLYRCPGKADSEARTMKRREAKAIRIESYEDYSLDGFSMLQEYSEPIKTWLLAQNTSSEGTWFKSRFNGTWHWERIFIKQLTEQSIRKNAKIKKKAGNHHIIPLQDPLTTYHFLYALETGTFARRV